MLSRKQVQSAVCLLVILSLASCQKDENEIVWVSDGSTTVDEVDSAEVSYPAPEIEAIDCEGRELRIAVCDLNIDARIPYSELGSEEQNADVFNDSMYTRNLKLSEKYNLVVKPIEFSTHSDMINFIKSSVISGSNEFDFAFPRINDCISYATSGYVYDFNDVPYVDFDAPWWLGSIMEESSILNKVYFAAGYANTRLFEATGAVYFNKAMIDEFSLENPYALVDTGEWTFDKFVEICKGITYDLNGDGIFGLEDRYGFATNNANWTQFYSSCQNRIITKNSEDIPEISFGEEKSIDMVDRIITFLNDESTTLLAERYTGYPEQASANSGGANRRTLIPFETFIENRAVFAADIIANIRYLRNMEADFGVLPPPKFNTQQENYIAYVHRGIASCVIIPITNPDVDLMGKILEDMMYLSYEYVRPAMFEIMLNEKYSRDNESAKSFDAILRGASLDLGLCMGLTIDEDIRILVAENNNSIMSVFQQKLNVNQQKIDKIIEELTD